MHENECGTDVAKPLPPLELLGENGQELFSQRSVHVARWCASIIDGKVIGTYCDLGVNHDRDINGLVEGKFRLGLLEDDHQKQGRSIGCYATNDCVKRENRPLPCTALRL